LILYLGNYRVKAPGKPAWRDAILILKLGTTDKEISFGFRTTDTRSVSIARHSQTEAAVSVFADAPNADKGQCTHQRSIHLFDNPISAATHLADIAKSAVKEPCHPAPSRFRKNDKRDFIAANFVYRTPLDKPW
jgi:hypothetical protein